MVIRKRYRYKSIGPKYKHTLYHSFLSKVSRQLTLINQKPPSQNNRTSLILIIILSVLGAVYFLFAYSIINGLWYHKLMCILSTGIFVYLCEQIYFELYEKQIKGDLPNTLKKLTHYYGHYQGNIIPALEDTAARCPKSNRIYILKMQEALLHVDYQQQIKELESKMPTIWLKMLCRLVLYAKENGSLIYTEAGNTSGGDVISNNLKRLTGIVTFLNIEQEYNDAELIGMQAFVFFAPLLVIPLTRWYYANLLVDFDMGSIYGSLQAQSITAMMLLTGSLGALYIHWMRKLQS